MLKIMNLVLLLKSILNLLSNKNLLNTHSHFQGTCPLGFLLKQVKQKNTHIE